MNIRNVKTKEEILLLFETRIDISSLQGPERKKRLINYYQVKEEDTDPYTIFLYAIRSHHTRVYYFGRLSRFFDAIGLCKGSVRMVERYNTFVYNA